VYAGVFPSSRFQMRSIIISGYQLVTMLLMGVVLTL
jgi:hypothetical protein